MRRFHGWIGKGIMVAVLSGLVLACNAFAEPSLTLTGTVFEEAGKRFRIDPILLYAVACCESAVEVEEKGRIAPYPWTLRTAKPFYGKNRHEAEIELRRLSRFHDSIDVGLMQINTRYHGHKVGNILELLDPRLNVMLGAEILSRNISRWPKDPVRAIGLFNSSTPEIGNRYAARVLRLYLKLKERKNE